MDAGARWAIAQEISEEVLRAHRTEVRAIGVHGSMAHDDSDDFSDIDLVVVTNRPVEGLTSLVREVRGVIVDFGVTPSEEYLAAARTLTRRWPFEADQYLTTRSIYDPKGWHQQLRETHQEMLGQVSERKFLDRAAEAEIAGLSIAQKAQRESARGGSPGVVSYYVGSAAVEVALARGLLTRTYYRGVGDALRRNHLDGIALPDLEEQLDRLRDQLRRRGVPLEADPTTFVQR